MRKTISYFLILLAVLLFSPAVVRAEDCDQQYNCTEGSDNYENCLEKLEGCWQGEVNRAQSEANTLQSTIDIINGQIRVQSLKIQQTAAEINALEKEITELSERIEGLGISLNRLSEILIKRIRESYKQSRLPYKNNLFAADSFNGFISQYRYVNVAQEQTLDIMKKTELQRLTYNQQKDLKETKQAEVEQKRKELQSQKNILDSQKASKDNLLKETKNNESIYQQKLAAARAELAAIRGIVAGLGTEVKVGDIKEGDRVASIIQGKSACSTGTHLHFEVAQNGNRRNPFDLLKNIGLIWDNIDPARNGGGDWNWPLNDSIRVTQGYGSTSYSSRYANDIHTGIDIVSTNATVKAVKDGELYRGSMACGGGVLKYVRVKQSDNFDSYYLHVNY